MKDFLGREILPGDKVVYAAHGKYAESAPILYTDIVDHTGGKFVICESGKKVLPRVMVVLKHNGDQDATRIQQLETEVEHMRQIAQTASEAKCTVLYELTLLQELMKGDTIEQRKI